MTEEAFIDNKERIRERLGKFTRKAFQMLPSLDKPRILDVGCGSGVPTLELAQLTNGLITAIDIDTKAISRLEARMQAVGLSSRVKAITCSMFDMGFAAESFDVIWSEGSIHPMGFERGLREWGGFLRKGGFLVVHDEKGNIRRKLRHIATSGYDMLGYFNLDEETWRKEYFDPLQKLIKDTREQSAGDTQALAFLDREQQEIDVFKKNPAQCCSVFFVLRKR